VSLEGLEDVNHLAKQVEASQPYLEAEADRYGRNLDLYFDTENGEHQGENGHAVSKRQLLEETYRFVEVIQLHEDQLDQLQEAREILADANDYRTLNARGDSVESLEGKVEDLIDEYQEIFPYVMEQCRPAQIDPEIPDPVMMKSLENTSEDFEPYEESEDLMSMFVDR
jgi:hypothetical protein